VNTKTKILPAAVLAAFAMFPVSGHAQDADNVHAAVDDSGALPADAPAAPEDAQAASRPVARSNPVVISFGNGGMMTITDNGIGEGTGLTRANAK